MKISTAKQTSSKKILEILQEFSKNENSNILGVNLAQNKIIIYFKNKMNDGELDNFSKNLNTHIFIKLTNDVEYSKNQNLPILTTTIINDNPERSMIALEV